MNQPIVHAISAAWLNCLLLQACVDASDKEPSVYGDTYEALIAMQVPKRRPIVFSIDSVQWLSKGLPDRREILEVEPLDSMALGQALPNATVFRLWSVPLGQDFTHSYNFDALVIQNGVMLLVDSDTSALRLLNLSRADVHEHSEAQRRATAFLDLRSYSLMLRQPPTPNLRERQSTQLTAEEWGMLVEQDDEGWVVRFTCLTELKSLTVRRYSVRVRRTGQMSLLGSELIHVGRLVL
jgi:hypothetical protein